MADTKTLGRADRMVEEETRNGLSPLAALGRTLEQLETRLSGLTPAAGEASRPRQPQSGPGGGDKAAHRTLAAPGDAGRPSLSDAVSQIVMRRQMLDRDAAAGPAAAPARAPAAKQGAGGRKPDAGWDRRFQALASEVNDLQTDGANYALMADIAKELQRLRDEMQGPPRFDGMRDAFEGLRDMIARREDPAAIDAEISRVDEGLAALADGGAEYSMIDALRGELAEMRQIVAAMARGKKSASARAESGGETQPKRELRAELARLRGSLTALAGEEPAKPVQPRREEPKTPRPDGAPAPGAEAISNLLTQEMQGLREKLEHLAGQRSIQAVEERWGVLEERFASREIEAEIGRMADRMEQLEASLHRLPDTAQIATLEERMQLLALNVESLSQQQQEPDLDHFFLLEERLDEISRAIIATSRQAPPIDMAPVERLEARLAALAAKVDEIADDSETDALSERVAELAGRIESLSQERAAAELTSRVESLSQRLESVIAEHEEARLGTADMEARLAGLATRLEETASPHLDDEMVRSLEAQIARLSQYLSSASLAMGATHDPDVDQRLAAIERRLDENRDAVIAAAREAADEAVRAMFEAGDYRESVHVARLSEDLRSLEALSKHTDDRANGFFDAVHTTLTKIVDRLNRIEADIVAAGGRGTEASAEPERQDERHPAAADERAVQAGAAAEAKGLRAAISRRLGRNRTAAPTALEAYARASQDLELLEREQGPDRKAAPGAVEAPSLDAADYLDSREMHRPLEVGSGAPDIAALLERVRAQQNGGANVDSAGKADFIAAARRAAMAAAAEAETLRVPAGYEDGEDKGGLADMISRRRKPILMAVGAVLLALMAMPLGHAFLSKKTIEADDALVAGAAAPVVAARQAPLPAADAAPKAPTVASRPAAGAGEPAKPAASKVQTMLAQPAATSPSEPAGTGTSDAASPPARSASPVAGLLAPAASDAPLLASLPPSRTQVPSMANARNLALTDAGGKLPGSATGPIPAVPEGIGNEALKTAAGNGNPKALFEVGLRLMEGRSGEPKPKEAMDWFGQAASRGFAPAQYSLGTLYEKGNGVERDTGASRDWYKLAAEQGNVRAMHNLAVLYATGIEGKSEPETAAEWFERAAEYGMRDSQYNLGILYARGAGVGQDLGQSYKWFSIVAAAGDKDAEEKRQEIAKSLSPQELETAAAAVAAFTPKQRVEVANTVDIPKEWIDRTDHTASVDMTRAIRNIQAILIKLGYEPGAPDGVAGKRTAEAIRAFQQDAGLDATGEIDETLIRALLERKDG